MTTVRSGKHLKFHPLGQREVRADFDGGKITSDGRGLLLREVEKRTAIVERFAGYFTDRREPGRVGIVWLAPQLRCRTPSRCAHFAA
jgi:hypothetical protein